MIPHCYVLSVLYVERRGFLDPARGEAEPGSVRGGQGRLRLLRVHQRLERRRGRRGQRGRLAVRRGRREIG